MTEQEIIADYPELQGIHIRAALAFAAERDAMTNVNSEPPSDNDVIRLSIPN